MAAKREKISVNQSNLLERVMLNFRIRLDKFMLKSSSCFEEVTIETLNA